MISVFYYYYYLFYTKIIPDDEPHATVVFTLSFSLSLFVNGFLDIVLIKLVNHHLNKWEMIGVFLAILIANYFVYFRRGKGKKVIKQKPKFFNSHKLSILITIIFFLATSSFLFWGSVYMKNLIGGN